MVILYYILVGVFAGLLGGFFGIGGGVILVPAFIYLFGLSMPTAIGTSLLTILPIALVGAWSHWGYGNVKLQAALWIGVFAAFGALGGAYLTTKVSPILLRKLFALFLIGIAIHLFLKK